jgi:hypothetical protein
MRAVVIRSQWRVRARASGRRRRRRSDAVSFRSWLPDSVYPGRERQRQLQRGTHGTRPGSAAFSTSNAIDVSHASIPARPPLFQSERYDKWAGYRDERQLSGQRTSSATSAPSRAAAMRTPIVTPRRSGHDGRTAYLSRTAQGRSAPGTRRGTLRLRIARSMRRPVARSNVLAAMRLGAVVPCSLEAS